MKKEISRNALLLLMVFSLAVIITVNVITFTMLVQQNQQNIQNIPIGSFKQAETKAVSGYVTINITKPPENKTK